MKTLLLIAPPDLLLAFARKFAGLGKGPLLTPRLGGGGLLAPTNGVKFGLLLPVKWTG